MAIITHAGQLCPGVNISLAESLQPVILGTN